MSASWIDIRRTVESIEEALKNAHTLLRSEIFVETREDASTWYRDGQLVHGLNALRGQILEALLLLERRLIERSVSAATARQTLVILGVYFDERIRAELAQDPLLGWRSIFQSLTEGHDDGAEAFYAHVESLLKDPDASTLECELSYFILARGFRGGLEPNGIRHLDYQNRLKGRFRILMPAQQEALQLPSVLEQPRSVLRYYGLAVLAVGVVIPILSVTSYFRWLW